MDDGSSIVRNIGVASNLTSNYGLQVSLWLASTSVTIQDQLLVGMCRAPVDSYITWPDLDAVAEYYDDEPVGPMFHNSTFS